MSEFHVNRQEVLPAVRPIRTNCLPQAPRPTDEERAWSRIYDLIDQEPSTALEVVEQLEADPQIRQGRLALLILAKQSVSRHETTEARRQRRAQVVRHVLGAPLRLARGMFASSALLAADVALPPQPRELATTRTGKLKRAPDFAKPGARFRKSKLAAVDLPAVDVGSSREAKAA